MTYLDPGTGATGAKRTARLKFDLKYLYLKVRHEHPEADVDSIALYMRDEALAHVLKPYLRGLKYDYVLEAFRRIAEELWREEHAFRRLPPSAAERAAQAKARAVLFEKGKRIVVKVVLLDLPMPNGKKLRDCTGGECLGFKGVFDCVTAIGRKIGPDEIVGEVLTETEVRKLYKEGK